MKSSVPIFNNSCPFQKGQLKKFLIDYKIKVNSFAVINVIGTNGKGTVGWQLMRHFQARYQQVGWFNSPSLFKHNERIQINGEMISDTDLETVIKKWSDIWNSYQLNFFEKWVCICLWYFNKKDVDIAIIEAGIGGEHDATSCFKQQLGVALTTVGLDHQEILGDTIDEIITTKVRITPVGVPLWVASNNSDYLDFITKLHQNTILAPKADLPPTISYQTDQINVGLAEAILNEFAIELQPALIAEHLPGRYTQIDNMIIDVAHNYQAIKALLTSASEVLKEKPVVILGCASHKDWQKIVTYLEDCKYEYYLCEWAEGHSWQVDHQNPCFLPNPHQWLNDNKKTNVVITGSFYFIASIWSSSMLNTHN